MQFPSFEEVPMSPHLDQPGINVLLGAASFKADEPALERLQKEKPSKHPTTIGIASAYRSAKKDGLAWRSAFETQYDRSAGERKKFATGPHGDEAFRLLLGKMPGAKAAAGFSNHTQGRAVDFFTKEIIDGKLEELTAKTSQHALWRKSWFFKWLVAEKDAAKYRFVNLATEEWHYDHQVDLKLPDGKKIPENPQGQDGELLASHSGESPVADSKT